MSIFLANEVNLYISYKLDTWSRDLSTDFKLGNCLFGDVKLTENADPDKYRYSGYGIGYDATSQFSWADGRWCENAISFRVDNSSSVQVDNKTRVS